MARTVNNPDEFFGAWKRRLRCRAFFEGVVFGMAAAAILLFVVVLAHTVFAFANSTLDSGQSLTWMLGALLFSGVLGGLINSRPSKFTTSQVARAADRIFPDSSGRFTAWAELGNNLPHAWQSAMRREIMEYLSTVEIPRARWMTHKNLGFAGLMVFVGFAGSLLIFLWNESLTRSRQQGVANALAMVETVKQQLLSPAESPTPNLPADVQNELMELVEHGRGKIEESRLSQEAESIAAAVVKELERRFSESQGDPSPSTLAAATEARIEETTALSESVNSDVAQGMSSGQSTAEQNLAEMLENLRSENGVTASGVRKLETAQTFSADVGSIASDASSEETGTIMVPQSLPEGSQDGDATGPAVPLPSELSAMESPLADSNLLQFQLPSEGATREVQRPGTSPQPTENFPINDRAQSLTDWNTLIEDASSQDVPIGTRETVRRYFEILRAAE